MPNSRKRPGKLLLPALFLFIPCLLLAAPAPPAPVPAELEAPGAELPEASTALSSRSLERLAAFGEDRARDAESVEVLAFLVDFSDVVLPDSLANLSDGVMVERREWFGEQLARVDEYYRSVSGGRISINYTLADSLLELPRAMATYGDDDLDWTQAVHWLASDAVAIADTNYVFSDYDLTLFIHAGPGQESDLLRDSPEQIWSGYVDFEALAEAFADSIPGYQGIPTDDLDSTYTLQRFAIAPESEIELSLDPPYLLGSLGVLVHQMGGYLGLVGLNDNVAPQGQGAGNFDLMSSGLWNALGFVPGPPSAFNRMLMGWADVLVHTREDCASGLDLEIESGGALHRFPISEREYFLVENRDQDANGDGDFTFGDTNDNGIPDHGESMLDAEWDYYTTQASAGDQTPGSGLLIWRIDEELLHLSFQLGTNVVNAWNDHYGVCLLEADGFQDLSYSPGYHTEAYGSDYDAFRAAGGPNELIGTQTAINGGTLPSTRSAEGALTGWSFSGISVHGPVMNLRAEWTGNSDWDVYQLEEALPPDWIPIGDPLGTGPGLNLHFLFAAWDRENQSAVYRNFPPGNMDFDLIASIDGRAVGSVALGDLDGDGADDIVLLSEDGGVYAWDWEGDSIGDESPLVQLDGWFTRRPLLFDADEDGDLDIFVLENQPDSLSTRPRFIDELGEDTGPGWGDVPGLPASDAAILLSVAEEDRGYEHPEPMHATIAFALADSTLRIHGLPLGPEETIWGLTRGCPCLNTQLTSGDLDGDGTDELQILRSGVAEIYYPRARFDGFLAGAREISPDPVFSFGDIASPGGTLLPMDADGNGSLEMLGLYPAEAALWSADGLFAAGWPIDLPANAPLVWTDSPAIWALTLRDGEGVDRPILFTRDGRFFPSGDPNEEPVLIGQTTTASPVFVEASTGVGMLMGLSTFEGITGTTAGEDTLLTESSLGAWFVGFDLVGSSAPAWAMAGGDAARTGRIASAGPVVVSSSGASEFTAAYPYPNPAGDQVTWRLEADSPDRVTLEIFDLEGQRLWSDELNLDGFSPAERQLALDDYAPGLYFFRIHSETSGRLATGRLAVIR